MLTESELVVLNVLMYNDSFLNQLKGGAYGSTIEECIRGYADAHGGSLGYPAGGVEWVPESDWNDVVNSVLSGKNRGLGQLRLLETDSLHERGSSAACFVDASGQPYVVFKGTGTDDTASEWSTNCEGLGQADTAPQMEARDYVDYVAARTGRDVVVTGHSNGGNKAMYAAVTSDHVLSCTAYDGQGFSPEFAAAHRDEIEAHSSKITNICTEGDFVNVLMYSVAGTTKYVQSIRNGNALVSSYGMNHSPITLLGDDCGLGAEGRRSPAADAIHDFTVWLCDHTTAHDREILGRLLGRITNALMGTHREMIDNQMVNVDVLAVLRSDPEGLGVLLAYLKEYPDLRDMVTTILSEVLLAAGLSNTDTETDRVLIEVLQKGIEIVLKLLTETKKGMMVLVSILALVGGVLSAGAIVDLLKRLIDDPVGTIQEIITALHFSGEYVAQVTGSFAATEADYAKRKGKGDGGGAFASNAVRDFSEAKLSELRAICREVRDEPFYDVSRWDVWYRGEQFFGHLNIDNYRDDINTFYRKMIDVMDMSQEQMRELFERAWECDATFGRTVAKVSSNLDEPNAQIKNIQFGV